MAMFFTSDTHFGHQSIIAGCNRPFASTKEMDEALIARWNAVVSPRDTIYHLGDFCHHGMWQAGDYLDRLNGEIHLVAGNHDVELLAKYAWRFASVSMIAEIAIEGQVIVLCHYPMREWNGCYRGTWHLFGHVHGRMEQAGLGHSMDVGVDNNAYRPVSFEEIARVLTQRDCPFEKRRRQMVKTTTLALSLPGNP
jgi:calcineurin-like phosphoesterase family protein